MRTIFSSQALLPLLLNFLPSFYPSFLLNDNDLVSAGTLEGYLNFTLSYFNTSDLDRGDGPVTMKANTSHPAICRLDIQMGFLFLQ